MRKNGSDSTRKTFRNDLVLIALLLVVALAVTLALRLFSADGGEVRVKVDGAEYDTYSLAKDQEISIHADGEDWENILVIEAGAAHMTKADCPDQICVNQGSIQKKGETIVCLPHKVVVEVISTSENTDETGVDVISK